MKALVTGGAGFIGRATCRALLDEDATPVVLDPRGGLPMDGCEVRLGDIRDATSAAEAVAHVDAVIHLAGVLGTQETIANPLPAAETNVLGGLNVLQAAAAYELPMVNIGVGNWFEDNTYSLTKNCVERFVNMYRKYRGLRVCTVRALNAYGPGQSVAAPYGPSKVRKIAPSFILRALYGHDIEVYGDGGQVMDMIYVDDVARTLVAALKWVTVTSSEVVTQTATPEVGTGRRTTVLEVAECVLKVVRDLGLDKGSKIVHLPMRPGETPGVVVAANQATLKPLEPYGVYGGSFRGLEDGMLETIRWYASRLGER